MQKRLAGIGVLIVGVLVIVVALMNSLFSVAPAFEDLTDGFRDTVMADANIEQARADVGALAAVNDEFPSVVAGLGSAFEMDAAGFQQMLGTQFPAVAAGVGALPAIVEQFTGVVNLIDSQQANFEDADQLPTGSLPATTLPWIIVGIGLLAIVVGGLMLREGATGSWLAVVLGIAVVVSTLLLSFLPKAGSADDMNDAFKPVYNEEFVAQSRGALGVVGAMGEELQTGVIPAVAAQLQMSGDQTMQFIGENYPATGAALAELPAAMGRFTAMVDTFDAQLGNYEDIKDTALSPISLIVLLAGAAIFVLGGLGLLAERRDQ